MIRSALFALPVIAVAAAAALWIGGRGAAEAEAETGNRAARALAAAGADWARAEADGLCLTLIGEAPDARRRDEARAAVAVAAPWARLADATTLRPTPPRFAPAPSVEILRGVAELTLTGAAPGEAAREALVVALKDAAPGLSLTDFTRPDATSDAAAPVTEGAGHARAWEDGARAAAAIAADLLHGRVLLGPAKLEASGLTGDEAALERIEAHLAALEEGGWAVSADLAAPPPAAQAFELRAEMGAAGGVLSICAAETEAEAGLILVAARDLFDAAPEACRVAPGAPDGAWAEAATAAMRAVAALPAGRISLVGRRARLTAEPPTRLRALEAARDRLAEELPPHYRIAVLAAPAAEAKNGSEGGARFPSEAPSPTADEIAVAAAAQPAETRLDFDGATLRLSGRAPNPILAAAAAAFARARFAGVAVEAEFTPADMAGGSAWRAAMTTLMTALTHLRSGEARLTPGLASVEGEVDDPRAIHALHQLVARGVGDERRILTRIAVSPARLAAETPLPASRCAEALNAVVGESPIIFDPGSTELDPEAQPVIDRLLEALEPCPEGRIEIGGHTDSQGSAGMNEGLSRARAFAVLDALLVAGANPELLTARGYGEAEPIADNGTEEGRARNRRIEFRVLPNARGEDAENGDEAALAAQQGVEADAD